MTLKEKLSTRLGEGKKKVRGLKVVGEEKRRLRGGSKGGLGL